VPDCGGKECGDDGCGGSCDCGEGQLCDVDVCVADPCASAENGTTCDDGNGCTRDDRCVGGRCAGHAVACDDGDPCTRDACAGEACTYTPIRACMDRGDAGAGREEGDAGVHGDAGRDAEADAGMEDAAGITDGCGCRSVGGAARGGREALVALIVLGCTLIRRRRVL
jgi:MYXO-CTERM domain-containing protein